jgi:hypothetical protein
MCVNKIAAVAVNHSLLSSNYHKCIIAVDIPCNSLDKKARAKAVIKL